MIGMEGEGSFDKVAERTAKLAKEAGTDAYLRRVRDLDEHLGAGRILGKQVDDIAVAERSKAIETYTAERNAGKQNDMRSVAKGLTALVFGRLKERVEAKFSADQLTFNSPSIEEYGETPDGTIYKMRMPEGVFEDGSGDDRDGSGRHYMRFHARAKYVAENAYIPDPDTVISPYKFEVVRIEGDAGELWQNPDFSPQGLRLAEPQPSANN